MTDKHEPAESHPQRELTASTTDEQNLQSRRGFLIGLGKWSRAVIAGAIVGGAILGEKPAQAGWLNRRGCCVGGGWINGGGGGWANRRGGWGGSWINAR